MVWVLLQIRWKGVELKVALAAQTRLFEAGRRKLGADLRRRPSRSLVTAGSDAKA
jgi:hypothetical protein